MTRSRSWPPRNDGQTSAFSQSLLRCGWILVLLAASGASCPRGLYRPLASSPTVFMTLPRAEQVRDHLNQQAARVQTLQTTGAQLQVPGAPALSASLALERPQRFRMQASLGFTGTEVDLGSNEQLVWFWAKRNDPPAVYYARHSDTSLPSVASVLPVSPTWLIEALGIVDLDPEAPLEGPFQQSLESFEVRSRIPSPGGPLTKVLLIDARFGHILQQTIYDSGGRLLARARASRHEYFPAAGVSLPREIDVSLPSMPLEFRLQVEGYLVNQSLAASPQLWHMPQYPGCPAVDLAEAWKR